MRLRGVALIGLAALAASCSSVEPYQSRETAGSFDAYEFSDRKQFFLQDSRIRVEQIAGELHSIESSGTKQKRVDEAKAVLSEVQEELKQLKYSSVRHWSTNRDDFLSTMIDLEEKYEEARRL